MKRFRLFLGTIVLSMVCVTFSYAADKPVWVKNPIFSTLGNSYVRTVFADGDNVAQARANAMNQVYVDRMSEGGVRLNPTTEANGTTAVRDDAPYRMKSRVLDEYSEILSNGRTCRYYLLVEVANNPFAEFDDVRVTDKYPFTAKTLVPGLAQIDKGSIGKGVFFIGAEAAMIAGIIISESQRSSYNSKINTTHDATLIKNYADKANNWSTCRNIFIGGAVAVYLWNVIDGAVAKGKKHVVAGGRRLCATPYYDGEAAGMALCMTF